MIDYAAMDEERREKTPEIGMGVTMYVGSDRYAGTIQRISPSGKTLWFTRDREVRTDKNGISENQEYAYTPDPKGEQLMTRKDKKGTWRYDGRLIHVGSRRTYLDPSF